MPEVVKSTIYGAVIQVGVTERPQQDESGEPLLENGELVMERIKVLVVTDPESLRQWTIWIEPGDEQELGNALAGASIVRASLDDILRNGRPG